jgi:hypothetical protein
MGNTNSQTIGVATGSDTGVGPEKQLTCNDLISKDDCNNQPNCIFLNGCQTILKDKYIAISSIPINDIIGGIVAKDDQPEKYKLSLIINNINNTSLLKSITIDLQTCNNTSAISNFSSSKYYLYPECNLFLSTQKDSEFKLKNTENIIHSFNSITSEITPEVTINQEQLDIIQKNEYKIKLIDIYNNEVTIELMFYPTEDATKKLVFNPSLQNRNKADLDSTDQNIADASK